MAVARANLHQYPLNRSETELGPCEGPQGLHADHHARVPDDQLAEKRDTLIEEQDVSRVQARVQRLFADHKGGPNMGPAHHTADLLRQAREVRRDRLLCDDGRAPPRIRRFRTKSYAPHHHCARNGSPGQICVRLSERVQVPRPQEPRVLLCVLFGPHVPQNKRRPADKTHRSDAKRQQLGR